MEELPPNDPIEIPNEQSKEEEKEILEENSEEAQESVSKKYTDEDVYTMISLVLRYPSGGHGGETFWTWMVKIYGNSLLEGRNGNGLRNRWRKIIKDHPSGLDEYKKQLSEKLTKEFVDNVEMKITEAVANVGKLGLTNKAYASLFPSLPRPVESKDLDKSIRKKKLENGAVEIISTDKKGKKINTRRCIDLDLLVEKRDIDAPKFEEENISEIADKINNGRSFVIVRNIKENTVIMKNINDITIEEQVQSYKKIDGKFCDTFKGSLSKPSKTAKINIEWTELEDMILNHPENVDMVNCLIKTHGLEEVERRKKLLKTS